VPILITCECGKQLRVKDDLVGRRVRCPACKATRRVETDEAGLTATNPEKSPVPDDGVRPKPKPAPARGNKDEDSAVQEETRRHPRPRDEDEEEYEEKSLTPIGPPRQTVLRVLVLVFALLGAVAAGILGFKWYSDANDPMRKTLIDAARKELDNAEKTGIRGVKAEEAKAAMAKFDNAVKASYILMAGFPVGIAAGLLAFLRISPLIAAVLMLAAMVGPAILAPPSLIFTSPFLVGAVLAFLVKSKPRAPRAPRKRPVKEDEDEEE